MTPTTSAREGTVTVGLLYAGEMGASLARALKAGGGGGARVVTTLGGRGPETRRRSADAGMEVLPSVAEVVGASDVVLSVVPPSAAAAVADEYCRYADAAPPGAVYVDANSIAPDAVAEIGRAVAARGRDFVDAAVNGLAKNLSAGGTLFLSGGRAAEVSRLFGDATRVVVLGREPGAASGMKMLLAGLSKGICGLYLELALTARGLGMDAALAAECGRIYPGVWTLVERMLPTYAKHAARRASETAEVEQTAIAAGLEPVVLRAVREAHEALAAAMAERPNEGAGASVEFFIEHLAAGGFLSAPAGTDAIRLSGVEHG